MYLLNMLDTKPSSLSPITPHNMECFTMWDQDILNPLPTKVEPSDIIMDFVDQNITMTSATIHHMANGGGGGGGGGRDFHFQNSQYLTPLGEPYCSSECPYNMDAFPSEGSINSAFDKYSSDVQNSFSDHCDNYLISDPSQQHHITNNNNNNNNNHHHHNDNNNNNETLIMNGHAPLSLPFLQDPSTHPSEYNWDDFHCDQDYFIRRPDYPLNSEIDSEEVDSKSSGESHSTLTDSSYTTITSNTPPKRKVGRPPKKDKKLKRSEKKTGRLWEFIRDLLKNPDYCPSLVKWENPDEGLFRFVNSEKVAQLWGNIKGNPRMTYEKLSRAMRYYYKSHVFEPVLGRRLVYKFGCNATNWRPLNNNYVNHPPKFYNC